jgi:hypothetical protein
MNDMAYCQLRNSAGLNQILLHNPLLLRMTPAKQFLVGLVKLLNVPGQVVDRPRLAEASGGRMRMVASIQLKVGLGFLLALIDSQAFACRRPAAPASK